MSLTIGTRLPSVCRAYRITSFRFSSQLPTYRNRWSGERAMPFVRVAGHGSENGPYVASRSRLRHV
jgi:hypothetical protein